MGKSPIIKKKEHINMNVPKALILFPTQSHSTNVDVYGCVPIFPDSSFVNDMRDHLTRVVELVKVSAKPAKQNPDGKWWTSVPYKKLIAEDSWCIFLRAHPYRKEIEKLFHGVTDFETLLQLSAMNLMDPSSDIAADLDTTNDVVQPVVIDFLAWHASLKTNGWFTGTPVQFYDALRELSVRTELDQLELHVPSWLIDVKRAGPVLELMPFEDNVQFSFRANVKHSDNEEFVTDELSLSVFLSAIEDALGSVRVR